MNPDKYSLGEINETQWKETIDTLYDIGMIQKKVEVKNIIY